MHEQRLFPFCEQRTLTKFKPQYGTPEFRKAYARYIGSSKWKKLCRVVRERAKCRCEKCSRVTSKLTVHHLTYERFRNEVLSDLMGLCVQCHELADLQREEEGQRRFKDAGEQARLAKAENTYLTKKYDEDWYIEGDFDERREEFTNWLEQKREREDCDY